MAQRDVAIIIPARLESRRLTRKALRVLAGRPLIEHVWRRVRRCRFVCGVFVATDSDEIADAVLAFGGVPIMTDPRCVSGTDRVAQALAVVGAWGAINVQGDEPFISAAAVDRVAQNLMESNGRSVWTLARPDPTARHASSPDVVKVVLSVEKNALYFSRAAVPFAKGRTAVYHEHIGIYGYSRRLLSRFVEWGPSPLEKAERLEQLRFLEHDVNIRVITTRHKSFSIDTLADFRRAEGILKRGGRSW